MVDEFTLGHQGHNAHDRRFNSYRNLIGTATGHGKASGLWTEMRRDVWLAQMPLPERFLNSLGINGAWAGPWHSRFWRHWTIVSS